MADGIIADQVLEEKLIPGSSDGVTCPLQVDDSAEISIFNSICTSKDE